MKYEILFETLNGVKTQIEFLKNGNQQTINDLKRKEENKTKQSVIIQHYVDEIIEEKEGAQENAKLLQNKYDEIILVQNKENKDLLDEEIKKSKVLKAKFEFSEKENANLKVSIAENVSKYNETRRRTNSVKNESSKSPNCEKGPNPKKETRPLLWRKTPKGLILCPKYKPPPKGTVYPCIT